MSEWQPVEPKSVEKEKKSPKKDKERKRKSRDEVQVAVPESEPKVDKTTTTKTHSFNDWEHAEFHDPETKNKFLKLMGAKKKKTEEEEPQPVKEDEDNEESKAHSAADGNEQLLEGLEKQYTTNMANHLKQRDRRHRGLGWHTNTETNLEEADNSVEGPKTNYADPDAIGDKIKKQSGKSQTSDIPLPPTSSKETPKEMSALQKLKASVKFVASSSDD